MYRNLALLFVLLGPADGWNIGGHSPVADHGDKRLVAAATFALGASSGAGGAGGLTLGDDKCACRGCGCILSATKQVVAGINWDITLRIVPKDEGAPDAFRRVTVFDETFKGGDDRYTVSKSEAIDAAAARQRRFTQAAVDSMTDPNAESHATSNLRSGGGGGGGENGNAGGSGSGGGGGGGAESDSVAKKYMDKLTSRMGNLVTTVNEPGDCDKGKVASGDKVSMHYTGTLAKGGSKFDSSYDRGQPFDFTVGAGQVIKGWEQAVPGMCVGEKAKLFIPSELAYGDRGFGSVIPPKSNLVFDIELVAINK